MVKILGFMFHKIYFQFRAQFIIKINELWLMLNFHQKITALENTNKTSVGYLYSILGSVFMTIMQVCAKYLSSYMVTSQMLIFRSFLLILINTFVISFTQHSVYVKKTRIWKILCLRMFVSALAVYLQFLPLKYLPLGIVNSIRMTAPICTHLLESCIVGTKLNFRDFIITCFSFIGILMLIKPEFIFGSSSQIHIPTFYALMTFLGTVFLSIQLILIRLIKDDVTNDIVLQYFYISQVYLNTLLFLGYETQSYDLMDWRGYCNVVFGVLVIAGYLGQNLNTKALYMISASQSMPFRYVGVIIGFLIDVLQYGISLDYIMIVGLTVTSVALGFLSTRSKKDKE